MLGKISQPLEALIHRTDPFADPFAGNNLRHLKSADL